MDRFASTFLATLAIVGMAFGAGFLAAGGDILARQAFDRGYAAAGADLRQAYMLKAPED